MTTRRQVLRALATAAVVMPYAARGQERPKARRLGWLDPGSPNSFPSRREAFHQMMRQAGFVEGRNLLVAYRFSHGRPEELQSIAADLVGFSPECIVATGLDLVAAVRRETSTVPIVMGSIDADPVAEGLVVSYAQPGGNVTGMVAVSWELAGKRLELLKQVEPRIRRVAVLLDPRTRASLAHLRSAEAAARALGLQIQTIEIRAAGDIESGFDAARAGRANALFVVAVGMLNSHREQIVALANRTRLPAVYSNIEFVDAGGMMTYGADTNDQFRRVAIYVVKILNGAKPADLPIVQPEQFQLAINRKTADALGVRIPDSMRTWATFR